MTIDRRTLLKSLAAVTLAGLGDAPFAAVTPAKATGAANSAALSATPSAMRFIPRPRRCR
ncbi:MAG: hypothetical protein ABJB78_00560 [Betaproteobacteria bacterium]